MYVISLSFFFFFFNDTATTEIYTLSLHDALPIYTSWYQRAVLYASSCCSLSSVLGISPERQDRKSTRLNSSHVAISYAVFCLKKKKKTKKHKHQSNIHEQLSSNTDLP